MSNKKKVNQRLASAKEYVDGLQNKCSKLNVIRIDLAYKKPHSNTITFDDANKDFNRMLNNRRNNSIFEHLEGYICKKEETEEKGVHFHVTMFYNGQHVLKDAYKADKIGEYWNKQITDGKGSYYNCNRNKYKEHGIGILNRKDLEKREYLDKSISYLCKDEQNEDSNDRVFVRGTMKKRKN
jgi:hypothetical protein